MFKVVERRMIVPNVHLLTIEAPEVAEAARPGNFIILRPDEQGERIPLTIADWDASAGTVTSHLRAGRRFHGQARPPEGRRHRSLRTPAPLATRPRSPSSARCVLIGGCYGIGSIYPIARALKAAGNRVFALIEARSSFLLYWEDRLRDGLANVSS